MAHDTTYKPSEKDLKILNRVNRMFELSKNAQKTIRNDWREAEKLYLGDHWSGVNMPNHKNKLTLDLVGSAIDTMIPILNSRPPKVDVIAYGGEKKDHDASHMLQAVMDECWNLRNMGGRLTEMLLDYLVYGTGIIKIYHNYVDDMPDGKVCDPFSFFVNPSATSLDNAEWVIYASPTPLYQIKELYPEKGKYVKNEGKLGGYEAMRVGKKDGNTIVRASEDSADYYRNDTTATSDFEERALMIECYMRDGSHEYATEEDIATHGDDLKMQPGVRKICMTKDVVLDNTFTKYPFFNRDNHINHPFPYITIKNMGSAHHFWGRPEPRRLKSLNLALDRISSQVMDNVHMVANPMWVVDSTADVQDQITNKPGQIIRKRGNGQVSMQSPGSMPSYVFNLYQMLLDMFETISGVNKATQGKADTNVTSGIQAQIYQKASSTKIDHKARAVEQGITELGQKWLTMFTNMGTKMSIIPFTNPLGETEYMEIIGILMQGQRIHVRAKPGSMLPENRAFLEQKILQLAQLGLIDDPMYLVQHLQLPGKELIINMMKEKQAQEQMAMRDEMTQQSEEGLAKVGDTPESAFEYLRKNPEIAQQLTTIKEEA